MAAHPSAFLISKSSARWKTISLKAACFKKTKATLAAYYCGQCKKVEVVDQKYYRNTEKQPTGLNHSCQLQLSSSQEFEAVVNLPVPDPVETDGPEPTADSAFEVSTDQMTYLCQNSMSLKTAVGDLSLQCKFVASTERELRQHNIVCKYRYNASSTHLVDSLIDVLEESQLDATYIAMYNKRRLESDSATVIKTGENKTARNLDVFELVVPGRDRQMFIHRLPRHRRRRSTNIVNEVDVQAVLGTFGYQYTRRKGESYGFSLLYLLFTSIKRITLNRLAKIFRSRNIKIVPNLIAQTTDLIDQVAMCTISATGMFS